MINWAIKYIRNWREVQNLEPLPAQEEYAIATKLLQQKGYLLDDKVNNIEDSRKLLNWLLDKEIEYNSQQKVLYYIQYFKMLFRNLYKIVFFLNL
jgi:hypothetical protein